MLQRILVLIFFFVVGLWKSTHSSLTFTKIECKVLDKNVFKLDHCFIKAVNRSYKYISVKLKILTVIDNIAATIDVRKKANGYKPFLYNITFDACKFGKYRKGPLIKYFFSLIKDYTNLNHSCPYKGYAIIDKIDTQFLNYQFSRVLPVPIGEYGVFSTWSINGIPRSQMNFFGKKTQF